MVKKAELWAFKSGKSLEDCIDILAKTKSDKTSCLPYVYLESQETKRRESGVNSKFPLFIKETKDVASPQGAFDCYGLSAKSNLPSQFGIIPHF